MTLRPIRHPQPGTVPDDHPKVAQAMRLYDEIFTDEEKRNVYRSAILAAVSAGKERFEGDRLRRWAQATIVSIDVHSRPEIREAIREATRRPPPTSDDFLDANEMRELLARLSEGIVRQIHGGDAAARLTAEQIEAEYDRYDRAETAASEDRCEACDPCRVPATRFVEAWDERPGRERYLGEWLLCTFHAEDKAESVRQTGAQVRVSDWSSDLLLPGGDAR